MAEGTFIAYLRVSTAGQGRSGLGLEAQREAIAHFLNGGGWRIAAEFVEVESGRKADRPQLAKALAACRAHKAKLLIAKLDRLSRNVHFISGLMESKVKFVACDMPHAQPFELHIRASLAEEERRMISQRTSAALWAKKAAGVPWVSKRSGRVVERLGAPDPSKGAAAGRQAQRNKADEFAAKMLPVIHAIRSRGITTLQGIANELTRQKWPTARGADAWSMMAVSGILKRKERLS
jgi:DNA invertase Pin-like site-specific DNA recombinase